MNEGGPDAANPETRDRRIYRRVLAVLIFHQSVWYLLYQIGMIPPKRPAWPLERALGDLQSLLGRSVGVRRWRRSSAD